MAEFRLVVTALAMMFAMFLSGVHGIRHRIGVAILGLLSIAWFTMDKLFEGDVLVAFGHRMGFTTADIVGVLGILVTAVLAARWFASPPPPPPAEPVEQDEVSRAAS